MDDSADRKNDPLGPLAHELRNRIAPIRNAADLIRMRGAADANLQSLAQLILRQLEGMARALDEAVACAAPSRSMEPQEAQAAESAITSRSDAPPASSALRRRILVADDSAAVRDSLTQLLQEGGHEVLAAADGAQTLELAAKWLPQVILLDINMPLVNGYEVARRLRAQFPTRAMKLVMMSGATLDNAARRGAMQAGFDYCVDKVFDIATLENLLARED